jgi:uncharacterized protein (UPF0297 family)
LLDVVTDKVSQGIGHALEVLVALLLELVEERGWNSYSKHLVGYVLVVHTPYIVLFNNFLAEKSDF